MDYEKRRLLMLRNRMIRYELESVTPLYHFRLQALLSGIPERLKLDNRLFARLLCKLDPALANLLYQRTMIPASAPVEQWAAAAAKEAETEKACRKKLFGKEPAPSYTRYYSKFDEWLLRHPGWQQLQDELLLSPNARIAQSLLQPRGLAELVDANKTGRQNNWSKIVYLMSIELYLRAYF